MPHPSLPLAPQSFQGALRGLILAALFGVFPVIGLLAPLGIAPLGMLLALSALLLTWADKPWQGLPRWVVFSALGLSGWAFLSSLWSLDGVLAAKGALQIFAVAVALIVTVGAMRHLDPVEIDRIGLAVAVGIGLTALILLADQLSGQAVTMAVHNLGGPSGQDLARISTKRGNTLVAVAIWPTALILYRRRGWMGAVFSLLLGTATVALGYGGTAKAAFLLGLLVAGLGFVRPAVAGWGLAATVMLFVAAIPWVMLLLPAPQPLWDMAPWLPSSFHHRLTIWQFCAQNILEKPVLGWGMEASRILPGAEDTLPMVRDYGAQSMRTVEQMLPLHPHNMVIQWWLELGGVGALICGLAIAWMGRNSVYLADRLDSAVTQATLITALAVGATAYGAWQSWWLMALVIIAALVGLSRKRV